MISPELIVVTGPMCSGKTEELIRQLRRGHIAGIGVLIIKPSMDTRSSEEICSRNGVCLKAVEVKHPQDMLNFINDEHKLIGIDEAHLFENDLEPIVLQLVRSGKRVVVAGLDLDYKEQPFETVARLMALAQHVHKLKSVCAKCKMNEASRSQRLVESEERIVIGDSEYEPRCMTCYIP